MQEFIVIQHGYDYNNQKPAYGNSTQPQQRSAIMAEVRAWATSGFATPDGVEASPLHFVR